jgi:hypothetical protein
MAGGGSFDFGLPDVTVHEGDHICAFYVGPHERDSILMPFLAAGMHERHKCVGVLDTTAPSTLVADLSTSVNDVDERVEQHQLELWTSSETYTRDGLFAMERMVDFWTARVENALNHDGFEFFRLFGEMTWALRDLPGVEEITEYESQINLFAPKYPQVLLCLYDLREFDGSMIGDMLRTHPKVLLGGKLIDNPHYVPPEPSPA